MRSFSIVRTEEPPIHVVVEDIDDALLVAEVRAEVLAAFRELNVAGSWLVAVVASDTRGRWDVGIRGPRGGHFVSFAASQPQVPKFAAKYVRRTLQRLVDESQLSD
jgi:hypothetical protein